MTARRFSGNVLWERITHYIDSDDINTDCVRDFESLFPKLSSLTLLSLRSDYLPGRQSLLETALTKFAPTLKNLSLTTPYNEINQWKTPPILMATFAEFRSRLEAGLSVPAPRFDKEDDQWAIEFPLLETVEVAILQNGMTRSKCPRLRNLTLWNHSVPEADVAWSANTPLLEELVLKPISTLFHQIRPTQFYNHSVVLFFFFFFFFFFFGSSSR
jgi:hypothetical protein